MFNFFSTAVYVCVIWNETTTRYMYSCASLIQRPVLRAMHYLTNPIRILPQVPPQPRCFLHTHQDTPSKPLYHLAVPYTYSIAF